MNTLDIKLYETGNGGDIMIKGNDLETVQGFENFPYLAMFGGNVEQTTQQVGAGDEQRFDWWGNAFLPKQNTQMNSITEKKLITTAITSQGRILIEEAIKADLAFMQSFANISVAVTVISDDWLNIAVTIQEPTNLQGKQYQFIWDATAGKILEDGSYIAPPVNPTPAIDVYRITQDSVIRTLMDGRPRIALT